MEKTIVDFSKLPVEVLYDYEIEQYDSYKDVFYSLYLDDDEFSPYSLIDTLGDMSIPEFISKEPYLYACGDKLYRWTSGAELMDELAEKYPDAVIGSVDKGALSYAQQAALFIKENPGIAWEVYVLTKKENSRGDIVGKLNEKGIDGLSDEEIDNLVDELELSLSHNESYSDAYWASVDNVVDDFIAAKTDEMGVSKDKDIPPSLDELVREYEHFIEVTKDIRTVEQAREFQKKFRIDVEINGVRVDDYVAGGGDDAGIEWIRYEFFGHLWYIYDCFDGEPTFDIYYGEYGEDLFAEEVSINDLKEDFSELVEDCVMNYLSNGNYESLKNAGETFGFTVPGGKHHIFVSLESFNPDPSLHYVVEPNRIIDGSCEPMGDTTFACFGDDDDLRKAIHWCLEQFEEDKEVSLDAVLDDAKDRVIEGTPGDTGKNDIIKD